MRAGLFQSSHTLFVSMAANLRKILCSRPTLACRRQGSTRSKSSNRASRREDIEDMLSKPSWSVRSLLPGPSKDIENSRIVSKEQLHHLLRLSALPQPKTEAEEADLLKTLQSQIHFVKEIQKIDTTGVSPLVALRDESEDGIRESTITMQDLQDALALEKPVGRNGRIRRQKVSNPASHEAQDWDPLKMTEDTAGRFFVVRKAKDR